MAVILLAVIIQGCAISFSDYVRWSLNSTRVAGVTVIDQKGKSHYQTVIITEIKTPEKQDK